MSNIKDQAKLSRKAPTKAIIAAAGFGTRFLPQTKAMPKEMLPLIDKPIIQYVVEELVGAGIRDIIIVGSQNKRAIEDHFDMPNQDLLANLRAGGESKVHFIDEMDELANMANFIYIRQKGPYGNASPILSAMNVLDENEPFIYTFADDFFREAPGEKSRFEQMIQLFRETGDSVLSCKTIVNDEEFSRYGIVAGQNFAKHSGVIDISKIVEKPGKANAPSNLASVSSYLLTPEFLQYLSRASEEFSRKSKKSAQEEPDGKTEEFTFQPIMQQMIDDGFHFLATEIEGAKYYDTGDKLEYLKTVIDFGLADDKFGPELKAFLREKLN